MSEPSKTPLPVRWLQAHGLKSLTPWHLLEGDQSSSGFRREYILEASEGSVPERDMLLFAHRQDCDDVAGFVVEDGKIRDDVIVAHLTYRGGPEVPGYPSVERFASFWEWLKSAIDDTAEWCDEESLADVER